MKGRWKRRKGREWKGKGGRKGKEERKGRNGVWKEGKKECALIVLVVIYTPWREAPT